LVSHGADKRGARDRLGNQPISCVPSGYGIDAQNCCVMEGCWLGIPYNVIYDSRFNDGSQSSTYFDDIVLWRSKGQL